MRLVITKGDHAGKSFDIEEGTNLIGRWDPDRRSFPEIDLETEDVEAKVSRKHAMLVRHGDDLTIEDLGSLNGTYLNRGTKITPGERYKLQAGDEIVIGKLVFRVEDNEPGSA